MTEGKKKNGRPMIYDEAFINDIADKLDAYIQEHLDKNEFPLLNYFASTQGIDRQRLTEWIDEENVHYNEKFKDSYKRFKAAQEKLLVTNALGGKYHAAFSIFTAKNVIGWRDEQHIDGTAKQEPLIIKIEGSDTPNSVKDVESQGNDS